MTAVGDGEELPDRVILKGSQGPAIKGALWFGMFAVFYALFAWEMYIMFAFVMWTGNRSPTISKKMHVIVMVFVVSASMILSVLTGLQPENPTVVAVIFASFFAAAVLPFFLAPMDGFRLELDGAGATLVDWWRRRTFLWSEYQVEIGRTPDGKVGGVGLSREVQSQSRGSQQIKVPDKRESVSLSDHFGMKEQDLADLMTRYRARALGVPLEPEAYLSPSWKRTTGSTWP